MKDATTTALTKALTGITSARELNDLPSIGIARKSQEQSLRQSLSTITFLTNQALSATLMGCIISLIMVSGS